MQFQVLGSLEVRRGDTTVVIGSSRQRTLLAALLADAGKVVTVDALADVLWGDHPPADPRNAIQTYVARLRETLAPDAPITTRSPGYVLEVAPQQVDALRFEQLLAGAQHAASQPARVRELLDEALGLWRGPAYAEFAEGVAHAEALRLSERRLVALEERAAARLALGEAADLVGELEALTAEHPLRERFVALRMRALAAVDRQAEALAAFRAYRERLADQTGLEPSLALGDLERRILRGEHDEATRSAPPPGPPRAGQVRATAGVPAMPTSLVGRDADIADVLALLDRERLVTLTGPGGVGKTRVAAEAARRVERDGEEIAWVELAPVGDPAAVDHVTAGALGIDLAGAHAPREALLAALTGRRLLLVLDNCEHLAGAVAPLVEQIGRRCEHVRVMATSRERLAVDGEWVRPLAPLPISTGAQDAVALFRERAAAANPRTDLAEHLPAVAEICRLVDGLPLAIELAAASTGALAVDDLLAALRTDAAAAGQRRGASERHRDLWAVADWSYRLLEADQQHLFERLSVFAGAFGVDEAHAVCASADQPRASTIRLLAALAERSLLTTASGGRYRMLRPLRAFARQRLADRGAAGAYADRHAAVVTAGAEQAAGPPLTDDGWRRIGAALDDLREAHRRACLTRDASLLGRLVAALYRFDYWRSSGELIGWADAALDVEGMDAQPTAPQVHAAAAAAAWRRGDLDRARRLAARGIELGAGPDDAATAIAFEAAGDTATFEGRLGDAEDAFAEEVRLARIGEDPDSEVLGLASAALVIAYAGRVAEGIASADAAADAAFRAGPAARAFARYAQGECRADTAPAQALAFVDEAAALAADCGASFVEGVALLTGTSVRGRHGAPAESVGVFARVIDRWRRSGNWTQQWTTLRNLAELLVRLEADDTAVVIAAAVEAQRTAGPTYGMESDRLARALATARDRIGEARFEAARTRGARMTTQGVVDLALATIEDRRPHDSRPQRRNVTPPT